MSLRGKLWRLSLLVRGDGGSLRALRILNDCQWRSPEDVRELQRSRLRELLAHAHENVPYYAAILRESGVVDGCGRIDLDAFDRIPLLDKPTIRQNFERLKSNDLDRRKWVFNTSGGSTGEPVRLIQDGTYWDWKIAVKLLYDRWTGYEVGAPKVVVWGSERDLFRGREKFVVRAGRWLKREVWLNTYRMTTASMRSYIERINRLRPVQILSYVESAYELARFAEAEGISVHSPRAIMTSAGTLLPHMRETIERVFRAPVFNRYGSREVGDPACECEEHRGLHVSALTHYLEILRPDGTHAAPGEVGEVVVTLLTNYAMPLIRYRIGDMAAWASHQCACGRGFPLLERVVGRTNSIIQTKSQRLDSAAVTALLYYRDDSRTQVFGAFSKYQIVQKSEDLIHIRVVVEEPTVWAEEKRIVLAKMKKALGEDVEIQIEEVEEIPPSPSGKYAYVISELEA